jgi:hypothetical protein
VSNPADEKLLEKVAAEVSEMCKSFPAPGIAI